jgi:hypothetical protein
LEPVETNLDVISQDVLALSQNVSTVNTQVAAVAEIATSSLDSISSQLRAMDLVAGTNLEVISQDVLGMADNVAAINEQIAGFVGLLDQYIAIIDDANGQISQVQATLPGQLGSAKTAITILFLWVLIGQLTPLYLGWELVTRQRGDQAS